jgi:hypothetical protein
MRSVFVMFAAVVALVVPVSAAGVVNPADYKNAAKFCKALRADMEQAATGSFKQTYGTNKDHSNAFGKCVSKNAHTVHKIHSSAVEQCKAAHAKPLGKCVRSTERQGQAAARSDIVNAAKQCRAERSQDPAAFRQNYGTNRNHSNAFGKCVSKKVRESHGQ